ncbi:LPD29 domain-containing protein [Enterobacter hormaechei]|uniref:LPD29 domain-containing protein n=1 Tax=Enterobacter hormaechei TaxID=158836 RepID=UPI00388DC9B8
MTVKNHQIGQCFSFHGKPVAVSVISLTDGVISYTFSRLDIPHAMTVDHDKVARRFGWEKLDQVLSLAELCQRREAEKAAKDFQAAAEKRMKEVNAQETETAASKYKNLVTASQEPFESKRASKNIRILLKENFKGTKFSVRMRDATCINVTWTDGPTKAEVEALIKQFQIGTVDSFSECYEYNETGFNKLYGGIKYLFTERSYTDELISKAIDAVKARYGDRIGPDCNVEAYRKGRLFNTGLNFLTDSLQVTIRKFLSDIS